MGAMRRHHEMAVRQLEGAPEAGDVVAGEQGERQGHAGEPGRPDGERPLAGEPEDHPDRRRQRRRVVERHRRAEQRAGRQLSARRSWRRAQALEGEQQEERGRQVPGEGERLREDQRAGAGRQPEQARAIGRGAAVAPEHEAERRQRDGQQTAGVDHLHVAPRPRPQGLQQGIDRHRQEGEAGRLVGVEVAREARQIAPGLALALDAAIDREAPLLDHGAGEEDPRELVRRDEGRRDSGNPEIEDGEGDSHGREAKTGRSRVELAHGRPGAHRRRRVSGTSAKRR